MNKVLDHICQADPELASIVEHVGPCRLKRADFKSVFEALAHSIVFQQLSGKAANTIYGRFVNAFGDGRRLDSNRVALASLDALREVGLSRAKAAYIQALAHARRDGSLPRKATLQGLSDAHVAAALTPLRGVGLWTVQMLLIFWLQRPDVLPAEDLGIRKGLQNAHRLKTLPAPKKVLSMGKKWAPYRSIASWYLWRAAEL